MVKDNIYLKLIIYLSILVDPPKVDKFLSSIYDERRIQDFVENFADTS